MKNKGITLIALIITIIVLLILAGVSIALVMGDNGILNKANTAKINSTIGDVKDSAEIIRGEYEVDHEGKSPSSRYIIEKLIEQGKIDSSQVEDYGDETGVGKVEIEGTIVEFKSSVSDNIFVALYNDGTLVFSNNESSIDSSKVATNFGNIKDNNSEWYPEWADNAAGNVLRVNILNEIRPTTTANWFSGLYMLTELDVSNINTENVTDMSAMFSCCSGLSSIDVSNFNTSNVTNMRAMFYMDDDLFDGVRLQEIRGLNSFDTSKVTDMDGMFRFCQVTELDLSSFDVSKVEIIENMFKKCDKLVTIYGTNWDLSSFVIQYPGTFEYLERSIFDECSSLRGSNGTTYSASHTTFDYAHIDGGTSNPGYFTAK